MIRAVLVLAVVVCAASIDAVSVSESKNFRRIRRSSNEQQVTCSADAMERAMESARAGSMDWWDDVKSGINTVVNAVNFVKAWECGRCAKCMEHAENFSGKILDKVVKEGIAALGNAACAATFDVAVTALCSAICVPIPVPGICPIACPPFVIYAHTKCMDVLNEVVNEIKATPALAALEKAKKAIMPAQIKALAPANLCGRLGLCPITRKDC